MAKNHQPQPDEEEGEEENYSGEKEQHPLPKTHKHSHSHSHSDYNPDEDAPVSNIKPTTAKRPAEKEIQNEGKESKAKKLKKKAKAEIEMPSSSSAAAKKHFFQRLWSEEDEIVILNGIMDYVVKKNANPVANIGDFLDFIKKSLHVGDVTELQLKDKISKLKSKYRNNVTKRRMSFSKSHVQRVYDLSKRTWGDDNDGDDDVAEKVTETPRGNGSAGDGGASVGWRLDYSGLREWIMNVGANKVEAEKRLEMERKRKKSEQQEFELYLNKLELICEQTRLVLENMKKGR